jgi:cytochrome c oxidase cbb3-type subunit 1
MDAPSPSAPSRLDREICASCRLPLLVLFVSAAEWLAFASIFSLIASIKFHSPAFLADCSWLTYGRIVSAGNSSLLYGFCVQAGLGVALWIFARLGATPLARRWLTTVGAMIWNAGVTIGVIGILAGDSTGFEDLEIPSYGALVMFIGYLFIGLWAVLTFHRHRSRALFPSQWFLLAAVFWFPWIYSTAELLLMVFPVRGAMQPVIAWWYAANLRVVWLGLVGIGAVVYFLPRLTGRELYSRYLSLFTFWTLILFGGWCGIPNSAPVPAWMPALSTVACVLTMLPVITFSLNIGSTLEGHWSRLRAHPCLPFVGVGLVSLILAMLMRVIGAFLQASEVVEFTWYVPATAELATYGFFGMMLFGATYFILPQLLDLEFSPKLVRAHFWLALLGILLTVGPLAIGGIAQGSKLNDAQVAFMTVAKSTLIFLRVSTVGILLIVAAQVLFLANLIGMVARFSKARAAAAYAIATEDLFKAEPAKP